MAYCEARCHVPCQCRSSKGTTFATSTGKKSQLVSVQSAAQVESGTTYMVVFQDAVSLPKIEQLCSSADSNYGFACAQLFSKTFKGFSATVSASISLLGPFCLWYLLP